MDEDKAKIHVGQLTDEHLAMALASLVGEMLNRHKRDEMSFGCDLADGTPLLLTIARGDAARELQVEIERAAQVAVARSPVRHH